MEKYAALIDNSDEKISLFVNHVLNNDIVRIEVIDDKDNIGKELCDLVNNMEKYTALIDHNRSDDEKIVAMMNYVNNSDVIRIEVSENNIVIGKTITDYPGKDLHELINLLRKFECAEINIVADADYVVNFVGCGGAKSVVYANNVIIDQVGMSDRILSANVFNKDGEPITTFMVNRALDLL